MKSLLIGAVAIVFLTGCYTRDAGRPGETSYVETGSDGRLMHEPNDRSVENKAADNLRNYTPAQPHW